MQGVDCAMNEGMFGESADGHNSHKATMETRLEYIEGQLGLERPVGI